MTQEQLTWDRFQWRSGADEYAFEIARGGLFGTLTAPGGRAITLPIVAWEGLFDSLKATRKTKSRVGSNLPARAGARWTDQETTELAAAFKDGRSIPELARTHARTIWAIEGQLAKIGLWMKPQQIRAA